jgi:hypothetical protein
MQRLMPTATAAHDADLAGDRRVGTNDLDRIRFDADKVGMGESEARNGLVDDSLRIVDDLLHGIPSPMAATYRATVQRRRRSHSPVNLRPSDAPS